jgi:hypothetical protein
MTHRRTTSRAAARFSQRSEVVLLQTRHAQARDSRLDVAIIAGVPRDLVNDDARRAYDPYDEVAQLRHERRHRLHLCSSATGRRDRARALQR